MKYVGKARTGTDENNLANVKSSVQAAVADVQSEGKSIAAAGEKFTYDSSADPIVLNKSEDTDLFKAIEAVTGGDYPKMQDSTNKYVNITVTSVGGVTVESSSAAIQS